METEIKVGNESPQVVIDLGGANRSFYYDHQKLNYKVSVTDKEDGTLNKGIDSTSVFVSFDYLKEGRDLALLSSNSEMTGGFKFLKGKNLIANSDCKSCHDISKKSIGPSYTAVAERYKGKNAQDMLNAKIIKGGNGNWGKNMMAPHPQHNTQEAIEMVAYILSLSDKQNVALSLQGALSTTEHVNTNTSGMYVIRASYTDKGNPVTGSLTGSKLLILRHPKIQAEDFEMHQNVGRSHEDGTDFSYVSGAQDGSYIGFKNVDLTSIPQLVFRAGAPTAGSQIEVRQGAPDGQLLGKAQVPQTNRENPMPLVTATLSNPGKPQELYLVFRNTNGVKSNILSLDWIYFDNGKQPVPKQ